MSEYNTLGQEQKLKQPLQQRMEEATNDSPGNFQGYSAPPPPFQPHSYPYSPILSPTASSSSPSVSAVTTSALIFAGGALGLSAAAAYRWLNGGDFNLMPGPPSRSSAKPMLDGECQVEGTMSNVNNFTFQELRKLMEQNSALTEEVHALVKSLHTLSEQRDSMLARIGQLEDARTDHSIGLLRTQKEATSSKESIVQCLSNIANDLSDIKEELKGGLSERGQKENWDSRLSQTLEQVQNLLSQLENPMKIPAPVSEKSDPKDILIRATTNNKSNNVPITDVMTSSVDTSLRVELARAVYRLAKENNRDELKIGAGILFLYVSNLSNYPKVPRYRKIYTCNEGFQKVDKLVGGRSFLLTIGFSDEGSVLEWMSGSELHQANESTYLSLLSDAVSALNVLIKDSGCQSNEDLAKDAVAAIASPFLDGIELAQKVNVASEHNFPPSSKSLVQSAIPPSVDVSFASSDQYVPQIHQNNSMRISLPGSNDKADTSSYKNINCPSSPTSHAASQQESIPSSYLAAANTAKQSLPLLSSPLETVDTVPILPASSPVPVCNNFPDKLLFPEALPTKDLPNSKELLQPTFIPKTPESGYIQSPPLPKKHILPVDDFLQSHPHVPPTPDGSTPEV